MRVLEELRPGSFRGVPFFSKDTSTSGGQRSITHEFAGSNFREVEQVGLNLKKFNITGIISLTPDSPYDTQAQLKINLMEALDEEGEGVLVHPFYGEFTVKAKEWTVRDSEKNLNESIFQMSFEIETDQAALSPVLIAKIPDIKKLTLSQRLKLDVAKTYFASATGSIDAVTGFVDELAEVIGSISAMYSQAIGAVSDLLAAVQGVKSNIIQLTNLPGRMANDLSALIGKIEVIFEIKKDASPTTSPPLTLGQISIVGDTPELRADIAATSELEKEVLESETVSNIDTVDSDLEKDKFNAVAVLFDFNKESARVIEILGVSNIDSSGEDAGATASASTDIGNSITPEQAEIIDNEKVLTRLIRCESLAASYIAAANIDFKSVDEIEEFQNRLEVQYRSIVADQDIPADTFLALQALRDASEGYFFNKKLTTNQVIDIDINPMPAQIMAFNLYGSADNTLNLVELNGEIDVSRISGAKKALTA